MKHETFIDQIHRLVDKFPKYGSEFLNEDELYDEVSHVDRVFEDDATIHVVVNDKRACIHFDQRTCPQSYLDRVEKAATAIFRDGKLLKDKPEKKERVLDMTPSWETAVTIYMSTLENPKASKEAKAGARSEILRLAREVDKHQGR